MANVPHGVPRLIIVLCEAATPKPSVVVGEGVLGRSHESLLGTDHRPRHVTGTLQRGDSAYEYSGEEGDTVPV